MKIWPNPIQRWSQPGFALQFIRQTLGSSLVLWFRVAQLLSVRRRKIPMTNKILVVPKLTVEIVTGETCYAGENGFSGHYAETAPEDSSIVEQLSEAREHGHVVTLRCSCLDVTGKITNRRSESGRDIFVLRIEDLTYRRP